MREIQLTQGQVALVDDEDFDTLNSFKWCAQKNGNNFYAIRGIRVGRKTQTIHMHRLIKGAPIGFEIDHKDGNGLNNQRNNLRVCTRSENQMNKRKQEGLSSIYKGVSFHKREGKWRAVIMINGKAINLGDFASEIEAAKAYDAKAIALFCEFANLNNVN